jgi:hypothetical protein
MPEPTEVAGPPGGVIDREWQPSYSDENGGAEYAGYVEPSSDPAAAGYVMGSCTDGEIAATLDGYGEWVEVEGYGRVWRPYTTAVGVDFTPYETCGSWVWTDWGWTFACEWDWGWLPFHYGRWGWFEDYWGWVPGYDWSPAAVEWRGGGGYVGWRPLTPIVRDHRGEHRGPRVRDHRTGESRVRDHRRLATAKDWQWRFTAEEDFHKPRIRSHLFKGLAEGLHVTTAVPRAPVRTTVQPVKAESIMRARLAFASRAARDMRAAPAAAPVRTHPVEPGLVRTSPSSRRDARPARSFDRSPSSSVYAPTWQQPRPARESLGNAPTTAPDLEITPTTPTATPALEPTTQHPLRVPDRYTPTMSSQPTQAPPPVQAPVQQPHAPDRYTPPPSPVQQPPHHAPERYTPPPSPVQQPPQRAPERYTPQQPAYSPPERYTPPTRAPERYTPPTQPTYSPPSRAPERYTPPASYSPPSRSSAPTYSPPSRSSAPASSGGGSRNHRR